MIITTTPQVEGRKIKACLDLVSAGGTAVKCEEG